MRPLSVVLADPAGVLKALRAALSGDGPAIMPVAVGIPPIGPREVPRRISIVVETSGSTAGRKRVALSADALLASAAASASVVGAGQWVLALPVHYVAGINVLVRSIAGGTEPVILGPGPFDPVAFAAAANRLEAPRRFTSLVPAQLARLLESDAALLALQRFDRILVGGQSTPSHLLDRARALGIAVTRTYGASETSGGCVYDGAPIGNTAVRLTDGQIEIAGSVLSDGYLDGDFAADEARNSEAFTVEGGQRWYRTGDTGYLHGEVLAVTGRLDDVIVSGGLKVSLAAIEREVRALPGQVDAVVVAVPDDRWGEVPVVVTTRDLPLDAVRERLTAALGRAAAPSRIVIVDTLPMLASGKPDRREIGRIAQ